MNVFTAAVCVLQTSIINNPNYAISLSLKTKQGSASIMQHNLAESATSI